MFVDLQEIQCLENREEAMQHLMVLLAQTLCLMGYERVTAVEIAESLAQRVAEKRLN